MQDSVQVREGLVSARAEIHLHAVDDGLERFSRQPELTDEWGQSLPLGAFRAAVRRRGRLLHRATSSAPPPARQSSAHRSRRRPLDRNPRPRRWRDASLAAGPGTSSRSWCLLTLSVSSRRSAVFSRSRQSSSSVDGRRSPCPILTVPADGAPEKPRCVADAQRWPVIEYVVARAFEAIQYSGASKTRQTQLPAQAASEAVADGAA